MDCLGTLGHDLYNKLCFGVYEAGNGHGIWFLKGEQMFDEYHPRTAHLVCFVTVKNSPGFV